MSTFGQRVSGYPDRWQPKCNGIISVRTLSNVIRDEGNEHVHIMLQANKMHVVALNDMSLYIFMPVLYDPDILRGD